MTVEYNQQKIVDIIKHVHEEGETSLEEERCTYILEYIIKALQDETVLDDIIDTIASVCWRSTNYPCECCEPEFIEVVEMVKTHITCLEDIVMSPAE